MSTPATCAPAAAPSIAGRYLTFGLGPESYGIPVLPIREIIRMPEVTPVPQMPAYARGVLNLRGRILPVIDLRRLFELDDDGLDGRTCVVVVQIAPEAGKALQIGLIVDGVEEVVQVPAGEIEPPPQFGAVLSADCVLGLAKVKGKVKTLLDIGRMVAADGLAALAKAGG